MSKRFILIHGGQMGAWAYDLLVPELRRLGHDGIAVDLPAEDLDAGASEYAEVVVQVTKDLHDDIVLVGHSLGGLTIPIVATRRLVSRLIFVCAAYPEPGRSHMAVRAEQPGEGVSSGPASAWSEPGDAHMLSPDLARELFFHDCPPDVQDWAIARMRLQARKPLREVSPLERWPDTPRSLIIATDDRCIPRDSALRTAKRLFGATPVELPGGHCPALARPATLARALVEATLVET